MLLLVVAKPVLFSKILRFLSIFYSFSQFFAGGAKAGAALNFGST